MRRKVRPCGLAAITVVWSPSARTGVGRRNRPDAVGVSGILFRTRPGVPWAVTWPLAETWAVLPNRLAARDQPVPAPARGQPGRLVGVVARGVRRRPASATSRCCCRVGYAACHWCHVMAHESFEDEATAAYMNEHFINVKVDREERPDVDAVYMQATTAMTGQGGWPMTVVLDPRGRAVLRRHLLPGPAAARAAGVPAGARGALRRLGEPPRRGRHGGRRRRPGTCARTVGAGRRGAARRRRAGRRGAGSLAGDFDAHARRVRRRPEVPAVDGAGVPAPARRAHRRRRTRPGWPTGRCGRWPAAASTTSSAAASRATPSTAAGWCRTSRRCSTTTRSCSASTSAGGGRPATRSASGSPGETADFLLAELRTDQGGFASALDADTEGVEGRFYVWTPGRAGRGARRRRRRLGGRAARGHRRPAPSSTAPSTLQLLADPDDPRAWASVREPAAGGPGATRARPARDDKVVAAWNGLADRLAAPRPGALLGRAAVRRRRGRRGAAARRPAPRRRPAAPGLPRRGRRPARRRAGGLRLRRARRCWRCSSATGDVTWLRTARTLLDVALPSSRAGDGGFFDTADGRRGAAVAAARPLRQRQPVRASRRWCTRCSATPP